MCIFVFIRLSRSTAPYKAAAHDGAKLGIDESKRRLVHALNNVTTNNNVTDVTLGLNATDVTLDVIEEFSSEEDFF